MQKIVQITIVFLMGSFTLFGQTKQTAQADIYFKNLSYVKAAEAYEYALKKAPSAYILERLGDCYYKNVKMKKAAAIYAQLFASYIPNNKEYFFKYAQSLRAIGSFKDSEIWMKKFHEAALLDTRGIHFTNKKAVLSEIRDDNPNYSIQNLKNINSEYSDFGVTEYKNTLLFSSSKPTNRFIKRTHTRNGSNFLDIFQVNKDQINANAKVSSFSKEINKKYHESSVSFSPDYKTIYFTRNNYNKGQYKVSKNGYNQLKIFKAEFINNKWQNIKQLPFCSNEYSVGHPSVSKDGKRLYFVSNKKGGFGKTDIYYVNIKEDGTFSTPKNLGKNINTEGREVFPFIAEDNKLYFSSDGHFGIGALDVFVSKQVENQFQTPVNLKSPINSELDDFAFSINAITKKGYLSSNRKGGLGDDDVYSVAQLSKPIKEKVCNQVIWGIVREAKFKKHLPYAKLILKDAFGTIIRDVNADEIGRFSFNLPCNEKFTITASKEYYKPYTTSFETKDKVAVKLDLDFSIEIVDEFTYNKKDELIIKINSIYFDYDRWNITDRAAKELDTIVSVMNKYPKIKVVSTSHTDARGREAYNQLLSQRRAESTVDYIVSKGISSDRISSKGYGETQLINNCVDNDAHTNTIKCTENQHKANRRTSFVILNVDGTKTKSKERLLTDKIIEENNSNALKQEENIFKTHIVSRRENLYTIAKKYKLTVALLKKINKLKSNKVYLNQLLIIDQEEQKEDGQLNQLLKKTTHKVKADETLHAIAIKYNTTIKKLKELNGLKSNQIIEGQILQLK